MKLEELCKVKSGIFQNAAGGNNFYISYKPKNPIGNVVICHGFCEFAEKYEEVAEAFVRKGYAVYVPEHRGHGYSQRECDDWGKVYIRSYDDYVEDLYCFVQRKVPLKQPRTILFAHSMGGAIGALFLEKYPTIFDTAVFSAPMFAMKMGRWPRLVAWITAEAACLLGKEKEYGPAQYGFDGVEDFEHSSCTSPESYQRVWKLRKECVAYQTYGGTYGWIRAGLSATQKLMKRKNLKRISIPVLIFQAERDHMVKNEAHLKFLIRTKHTALIQIKDSKHEIFHSKEEARNRYYKELFDFLEYRIWLDEPQQAGCLV